MFNKKKKDVLIPAAPKKQVEEELVKTHPSSPLEMRSRVISACLDATQIDIDQLAAQVSNQAYFRGLTRLRHEGALAILKGVIGKTVDVSILEWQCIVYVVTSPVITAIKKESGLFSGDEGQLKRRAAVVRACILLSRLTFNDVVSRVKNAAFGYLNVRSLQTAAEERIQLLMDGKQDVSDVEWTCVKIGLLNSAPMMIREFLEGESCLPAAPVERAAIERRIRIFQSGMLIAGLSGSEAASAIAQKAQELHIGALEACMESNVENFVEQRYLATEEEWRCMAEAVLSQAENHLVSELAAIKEGKVKGPLSQRKQMLEGCALLENDRDAINKAVQQLASRFDVEKFREKPLAEIARLIEKMMQDNKDVNPAEYKCFSGLLVNAASAIKQTRIQLNL